MKRLDLPPLGSNLSYALERAPWFSEGGGRICVLVLAAVSMKEKRKLACLTSPSSRALHAAAGWFPTFQGLDKATCHTSAGTQTHSLRARNGIHRPPEAQRANEGSIQEQPKIPNASQHTTPLQRCPLCHRTNCPEQRTNNTHEPAILSRGKSIAAALQWALGER